MKIAHISDLHFTTFFSNSNFNRIKHLFSYALSLNPDHFVVTGDLTDNADPNDFEILRDLFKSLNILNSDKLTVIIGNHDIFGGIQASEDIINFPQKCSDINYHQKVIEFTNYFEETFRYTTYQDNEYIFPFAKIFDNILITGANSIADYSKLKNPFASNGKINKENLEKIGNIFELYGSEVKFKVFLLHHHFNKTQIQSSRFAAGIWHSLENQTMKLRKKKRIINILKQHKVDLVLHGHIHENKEYFRKGVRFLNGGGSVKGIDSNLLHLNFIEINNDYIITEIHKLAANSAIVVYRNSWNAKKESELNELQAAVNF
jgi:3',5'-cyclic AMP phosphodiesterase CpdA